MDLFQHSAGKRRVNQPLPERMRPMSLDEVVGQRHLLGPGKLLPRILAQRSLPSLILWGPPGTGKTTLARILAERVGARFAPMSAVMSGVRDIREVVARAAERRDAYNELTVLFIDEIHRFSKSQQDALLPHVEAGTVTLIGATTENPSFQVNAALLSRARVLRLEPLDDQVLGELARRALADRERGLGAYAVHVPEPVLEWLVAQSGGDARRLLGSLEVAVLIAQAPGEGRAHDDDLAPGADTDAGTAVDVDTDTAAGAGTATGVDTGTARVTVTLEVAREAVQQKTLLYDKAGDEHYAVVSAFIKSMRGSDPDAAVYWMARMLESGEDPLFVLRRMVIFAAEDVGNADPRALTVATSALSAFQFMGLPEGVLPMTQAVLYLACAPKSNSALTAYAAARKAVREHGALPVPLHLRNAVTQLQKDMGYSRNYKYPHEFAGHYCVHERYLPEAIADTRLYSPSDSGYEATMKERIERWRDSEDPENP